MILVDNAHFGRAMQHARRHARLKRDVAARLMGVTRETMRRWENGKTLVPQDKLEQLMFYAFLMLNARTVPPKKTPPTNMHTF